MSKSSSGRRWLLIPSLFLFIMVSCGNGRPRNVLSESKMENLLYDYHLAQASASIHGDSSSYYDDLYKQSVFRNYKISKADFDRSMLWYTRHTDLLYKIYTRIDERYSQLSQDRNASRMSSSSLYNSMSGKTAGDTANVWNDRIVQMLSPQGLNNTYSFSIKVDSSYHPRDRFVWHFSTKFVYSEGRKEATAVLTVRYSNESTTTVVQSIYGNNDYDVSLTASDLPIKSIDGFIYLNERWTENVKLLYLSQFSLFRFHAQHPKKTNGSPLTDKERADSLKAVRAGEQAIASDAEKKFIDSIQGTAKPSRHEKAHFKVWDKPEPRNNPLLNRSRAVHVVR